MDYEQKYKEALTWIKGNYVNLSHEQQMEVEALFPELKESEDERIRKAVIGYINHEQHYGVSKKDMIAWLEKQGKPADKVEQKPQRMVSAEAKEALYDNPAWSEEDEETCQDVLDIIEALGNGLEPDGDWHKLYDWLKSLKERITWMLS